MAIVFTSRPLHVALLYLSIPWFGVLSYPITSQSPSTRDVAATATRTDTESVTAVSFPRTENSAEIPFGGDAFESETRDNATFAHVQINGFQLFCTKSPEECKVEVRDWMSSILRGDMIRDNATMATTATATATAHVSKQRGPTFTNDPCFSLHAPSSCFVTTYPTTNFATWPAVVNTTWVKPYPTVVATNDLPLAAGSLDSCTRYTQWFDSSRKKKVMPNSCGTVAWVYGITINELISWNPSLIHDANNPSSCVVKKGYRYCINGDSVTSTSKDITAPATSTTGGVRSRA